jgi:hypothetical protein
MSPAMTQDMVDGMDDTAGLLRPPQPAFVFAPSGIRHDRAPALYRVNGLTTPKSRGIRITGSAQGQRDADRRDAIKRGGI